MVLMVVGIGLIGVLTATVASYFIGEGAEKENAALQERLDRIEGMLVQSLAQGADLRQAALRKEPSSQPTTQD